MHLITKVKQSQYIRRLAEPNGALGNHLGTVHLYPVLGELYLFY